LAAGIVRILWEPGVRPAPFVVTPQIFFGAGNCAFQVFSNSS